MPLATMGEIIGPAQAASRGVGAFNVIGIEHAEAIVAGAEGASAPVILQISENCVAYHGALEPIARACLAVARSAAALTHGLVLGRPWDERLRHAAALGAATAAAPVAGEFRRQDYLDALTAVTVEEVR